MTITVLRSVLLIQVVFSVYASFRKLWAGSICWGQTLVNIAFCLKSLVIALFILSIWNEPDRIDIIILASIAYGLGDIGQILIIMRTTSINFGNLVKLGLGYKIIHPIRSAQTTKL